MHKILFWIISFFSVKQTDLISIILPSVQMCDNIFRKLESTLLFSRVLFIFLLKRKAVLLLFQSLKLLQLNQKALEILS